MAENPIFDKNITRAGNDETGLRISEMHGEVEYTGNWEKVDGAKGVTCRIWKIKDVDGDLVDGADILIEAGGYTPIQLVKAAEVVVDAPEEGRAYCCVMDTDGQIYVNYFDGSGKNQMVWSQGMIVTWIAETEVRMTELESPAFGPDMFANAEEDKPTLEGRSIVEFVKVVNDLRQRLASSPKQSPTP